MYKNNTYVSIQYFYYIDECLVKNKRNPLFIIPLLIYISLYIIYYDLHFNDLIAYLIIDFIVLICF